QAPSHRILCRAPAIDRRLPHPRRGRRARSRRSRWSRVPPSASCRSVSTRQKVVWIALLYFAEGFPFGLVVDNLPVYFRAHGVSLEATGWLRVLGLPWTLKVFWAPLVDRLGERRHWITGALLVAAAATAAIPLVDPRVPGVALWTLLLTLTIASATQDIA